VKALVRAADGIVVGLFEVAFPHVGAVEWVYAGNGAGITAYATRWDGSAFVPAPPAASAEIAPLAFFQRFTAPERAAIRAAAAASADLADWNDRARFARVIDLAAAETVAGMAALVAGGLLTSARRDAILTAPIAADERP
jgi:hypothetical protein